MYIDYFYFQKKTSSIYIFEKFCEKNKHKKIMKYVC